MKERRSESGPLLIICLEAVERSETEIHPLCEAVR